MGQVLETVAPTRCKANIALVDEAAHRALVILSMGPSGLMLSEDSPEVDRFVGENNDNPKPIVWTAGSERVLAAVKRGKEASESIH